MLEDVIRDYVVKLRETCRKIDTDSLARELATKIKARYEVNEMLDYMITLGSQNWKQLEGLREDVECLRASKKEVTRLLNDADAHIVCHESTIKRLTNEVEVADKKYRALSNEYSKIQRDHAVNKKICESNVGAIANAFATLKDKYDSLRFAHDFVKNVDQDVINNLKKQLQELNQKLAATESENKEVNNKLKCAETFLALERQSNMALKESNLSLRNTNDSLSEQIIHLSSHNGCAKKIKAAQDSVAFWTEEYNKAAKQSAKKSVDLYDADVIIQELKEENYKLRNVSNFTWDISFIPKRVDCSYILGIDPAKAV